MEEGDKAYCETTDYCVGDVSDARLDGKEVLGQATMLDFMLQELDQVACDGAGSFVFWSVGLRLIWVVTFDNGNNAFRIDRDMRCADTIFGRHDQVRLSAWRKICHCDVVKTFERWSCGVDFNDDLVGHLDKFGRCSYTGTWDDATVFSDS